MKNKTILPALLLALFLSNVTFGQEQTNPQQSPKDKTFKERKMREYLNELYYLPAKNQKAFLTIAFNEWRGDNVQTDDVCLLGVRL